MQPHLLDGLDPADHVLEFPLVNVEAVNRDELCLVASRAVLGELHGSLAAGDVIIDAVEPLIPVSQLDDPCISFQNVVHIVDLRHDGGFGIKVLIKVSARDKVFQASSILQEVWIKVHVQPVFGFLRHFVEDDEVALQDF